MRIVFGGLSFVGPDSERGMRFALAAGRQDKLWDVIHLLYASQGAENSGWVSDALLRELGAAVPGLDTEHALREASSPEVDRQLSEAQALGTRLGRARYSVLRGGANRQDPLADRDPKPRCERLAPLRSIPSSAW